MSAPCFLNSLVSVSHWLRTSPVLAESQRVAPFVRLIAVALFVPALAAAQDRTLDARVESVVNAVANLQNAEAIQLGTSLLASNPALSEAQELRLRTAIAAAYYPDEEAGQQADAAVLQLSAILTRIPDARLPIELRWAGLDSLLEVARSRTFAVRLSYDEEQVLVGPDARGSVSLVATRPAQFHLSITPVGNTAAMPQDSTATADTRATLRFRALDGRRPLLAPGGYRMVVTAREAGQPPRVVASRDVQVAGSALVLIAPPTYQDPTAGVKTRRRFWPSMGVGALAGVAVGALAALGAQAQGEAEDEDVQAGIGNLALGTALVTGTIVWRPWRNSAAHLNREALERHRRAVDAADTENQRRVENYRVELRIAPAP